MSKSLAELWDAFVEERSISLCPTSLTSDYRQVGKWLRRCPVQDIDEARKIMIWVLGEKPVLTARRVAMYTKTMYKWAAQEDIALVSRNPLASFKMPKAPQKDEEIIVIPRHEIATVLATLGDKKHIVTSTGRGIPNLCCKPQCVRAKLERCVGKILKTTRS